MSRLILVALLTSVATAAALAQTSNQEPTIRELQKQLDEMRSQMAKIENSIQQPETSVSERHSP
jgi:peptidoglycan hydrolase CwlO-like protein